MSDKPYRVNRSRKKNMMLPALALIVFAVALSLVISGVWQALSGDDQKLAESGASSAQPERAESEAAPPEKSAPQAASSAPEKPPAAGGTVPKSEPVGNSYFDDAVFVGDSITTGIQLYGVMTDTEVLAGTGINLASVYTAEVVKQEDGAHTTIMDGLEAARYRKIYVMLGGNEVRDEDKKTFIARYEKVLDDIKLLQPDALLYVQSILPVTKVNNYKMDNLRIDEFNKALLELCEKKDVYYLNVAESMKDADGMLPDEASPADGMHFGPDYYNKWFDYLRSHTVSGAAQTEKEITE